MLIATRTIERAVNGKDESPGAPPEWQAKQIETLPVETLKGIGSVLEGIGDSGEKEGFFIPVESENNTVSSHNSSLGLWSSGKLHGSSRQAKQPAIH